MPSMRFSVSWMPYTQKIAFLCLLVATPMLASSLVILYIVYDNLITPSCPFRELCLAPDLDVRDSWNYYVDFPAARIAFISSWSSTVSFALVSFLMALSAYADAAALLGASESRDQELLPSPYQMSVLLRTLNAELMVLWELILAKAKGAFWKRDQDVEHFRQTSPIVRNSMTMLLSGLMASLLVQAADVYLHIAVESIELYQVQELSSDVHLYSRGLAPWCLDRPNMGPLGPKNFWGCALTAQVAAYNNATTIAPTNATIIQDLKNSVSDRHTIINFTDPNGIPYAVVGPANVDASQDWKAHSFGVSTICSPIPENACDISDPITNAKDGQGSPIMLVPFVCDVNRTGIDITGNLTSHNTITHMINFQKYAEESSPFLTKVMETPTGLSSARIMENIQNEDADEIFKNSWAALVMRKIPFALQGDFEMLPPSFRSDERVWKHGLLGAFTLMLCNATVWDVTYVAKGGIITSLTKSLSNGSTAGIASMSGTRFIGSLANVFQDESTGPESRSSPEAFIRSFELGMSKAYSYPLASQMSGRPALLAQAKTSKVITKLPVAALWFLVVANLGYAMLGVVLAMLAKMKAGSVVHQVQMRLSVAGLAAALFDRERFESSADSDDALFEEKQFQGTGDMKKVGVSRTGTGGSCFIVLPLRSQVEEERDMKKRYFGSIIK